MIQRETNVQCEHCMLMGRTGKIIVDIEKFNIGNPSGIVGGPVPPPQYKVLRVGCDNEQCCTLYSDVPGHPGMMQKFLGEEIAKEKRMRIRLPSKFLDGILQDIITDAHLKGLLQDTSQEK